MRIFVYILTIILPIGIGLIGYGYYEATSKPIARKATITVGNWPTGPLANHQCALSCLLIYKWLDQI